MIAGVCGGLAEYFGVDGVWVRLIFVLLIFASGLSLILYPILWWIMPEEAAPEEVKTPMTPSLSGRRFAGLVLVVLGTVFLLRNLGLIRVDFDLVWPTLLILLGLYFLAGGGSPKQHPYGHKKEKKGEEPGEGADG